MNYESHYQILCERARDRKLDCYTERHHIVPKCMGGSDDPSNLVDLTAEEHYVAHQLLVKIHPNHSGLIWAAIMMTGHSSDERSNNKNYGWLKRKWSAICKSRTGKKNGSFGRKWFYDPETLETVKCLPEECPEGFISGRRPRKKKPNNHCKVCGVETGNSKKKFCDDHRPNPIENLEGKRNDHTGSMYITDGHSDRLIPRRMNIPEGFWKGRTNGLRKPKQ